MGKLAILKLGVGSFEEGFLVTLQIGEDGRSPSVETVGQLPPAPEIPNYCGGWASAYRRLGLRSRLEATTSQVKNVSKIELCSNAAHVLRGHLNTWLHSEAFRPVREKLLEQLMPSEEVRLIIQTENIWLRRLPWHLWDLCDRYPKVEIALSAPIYEGVEQPVIPHAKARILAVLGNSAGINTQADRVLLEELPDAQVSFLVEPQRQELNDELWRQEWDILFFAGHSSSQADGETGRIYINQTDSLTIDQLKFALRKAVERGLKIAIFNSCDGLGLARDLADLKIPQIIVMREPVPDRIAQEFLKYFLEGFAGGKSFYLAVREARERLQGWEDQFPCATWLPIICQNPAIVPPTWQGLRGRFRDESSPSRERSPEPPNWKVKGGLAKVFCLSLAITSLLMGVRHLGILQPLELQTFDHLMQKRPAERPDSRLLVVKITEADIQAQKKDLRAGTSLSDRSLAKLLEILESYQARAIGLDIYRDFPAKPDFPDLAKRMRESDRFVAVCKVSNPKANDPGIAPPPEVLKGTDPNAHIGFADFVLDSDGVLRRHLLKLTPPPASACTASNALSTQLALRYLAAEGIFPKTTKERYLQLGSTIFKPLETRTGGYQNIDAWGYQVLLNYRSHRSPQDFAEQVTLTEVLKGQLNPDAVKNKVILIGVTAPSRKDFFLTPYSTASKFDPTMPGVVAHAQMVSQILSTVLDRRPLIWVFPMWGEALWIWGWALAGGLLFWRFQPWLRLGLAIGELFLLYGISCAFLIQGGWVPLVPSAIALVLTGSSVVAYSAFTVQQQQSKLVFKV